VTIGRGGLPQCGHIPVGQKRHEMNYGRSAAKLFSISAKKPINPLFFMAEFFGPHPLFHHTT
jgi:hypothetical protein